MLRLPLSIPLLLALALLAGCSSTDPDDPDSPSGRVEFVPVTPPLYTDYEPLAMGVQHLDARGDLVLYASYLSRDGGQTWLQNGPGLGTSTARIQADATILQPSPNGLLRYTAATNAWAYLTPGPPTDGPWAMLPDAGVYYVAGPQALHRWQGGAWTSAPYPAGTLYVVDVEAEGSTVFVATGQGLLVSPDAGATWTLRMADTGLRELVRLPSGRLLAKTYGNTIVATDDGGQTMTTLASPSGAGAPLPRVMPDGRACLSRHCSSDGGATWTPMLDANGERLVANGALASVYLPDRSYLSVNGSGLFRSKPTPRTFTYIGGLRAPSPPPPARSLLPFQQIAVLPGGQFVVRTGPTFGETNLALYTPGTGAWTWMNTPVEQDLGVGYEGNQGGVPTRLRDGRLALILPQAVWFSTDDGHTWGPAREVWPFVTTQSLRPSRGLGLIEAPGGRLYAVSQWQQCNPLNAGECFIVDRAALSRDGGQTWAPVYEHTEFGSAARRPLTAVVGTVLYAHDVLSRDGGQTWEGLPAALSRPLINTPDGGVLYAEVNERPQVLRLMTAGGERRALGEVWLDGAPPQNDIWREGTIAAVDAEGYGYVVCGDPAVRVCKSTRPLR